MIVFFFLLILSNLAYPNEATPVRSRRDQTVDPLTAFIGFAGCGNSNVTILKQTFKDLITLADAGLDSIHDELLPDGYPSHKNQQVDFSKQAAIEFFGPESENAPEQARIFDTMYNTAQAYNGWGFDDWWNDRGVFVSCLDEAESQPCRSNTVAAYYLSDHKYGYPLIVVCNLFFTHLKSLDDAIKTIDGNADLQQNVLNLESRATCFMHEMTHIGWGTAKVCRGVFDGEGCRDHVWIVGNELHAVYGPGYSKLIAKLPFDKDKAFLAATNSDNYAFYAAAKFMEKRWKKYPKYPSAWDPNKKINENRLAQRDEPGFPPDKKNVDIVELMDDVEQGGKLNDLTNRPLFPVESYPEWYQPVIKAKPGDPVPDVKQPEGLPTYNGPGNDDIACETSDGSPKITDCFHAFGGLKMRGGMGVLHGKKDGTWWAGYVNSCTLAVYYTEDWGDGCGMTLKDVNDYSTAIMLKCSKGDKNVIGGHAAIKLPNCPGQVQIYNTGGVKQVPQGGL